MRQIQFNIVKEPLFSLELGSYYSYGIAVHKKGFLSWDQVEYISDVSPDSSLVFALADICTRLQLDPCHLYDVVVDAIS